MRNHPAPVLFSRPESELSCATGGRRPPPPPAETGRCCSPWHWARSSQSPGSRSPAGCETWGSRTGPGERRETSRWENTRIHDPREDDIQRLLGKYYLLYFMRTDSESASFSPMSRSSDKFKIYTLLHQSNTRLTLPWYLYSAYIVYIISAFYIFWCSYCMFTFSPIST